MRGAFLQTLADLAATDPRILLLTGDLGYLAIEPFSERFPDRFFNVGVAEQNLVGLATGLAEAGFLPFVYSIATFASLRPYEFIRNGPVLHRWPVRVVGVGGGFEYGTAGPTHHGLEDVGVMRLQPGLTVIAPADPDQARAALLATWDRPGPVFYRIGKDDRLVVPGLDGRFELGRVQIVRTGPDLVFFTLGSVATEVVAAADWLAEAGVRTTVAVVASVAPPPIEDLTALVAGHRLAIAVEAHFATGGLGSLIAEVIAEGGHGCRLIRRGVRHQTAGRSGSQDYYHRTHGLNRAALVETVRRELEIHDAIGPARSTRLDRAPRL